MQDQAKPNHAEPLAEIRGEIDAIDTQLLALLNRRAACAQKVAVIKTTAGENECFHRPEREAEILRRVAAENPGPLGSEVIVFFFRELMSECLALEKPLSVAFLGPAGTFSQQATYKHFGHGIQSMPLACIDEVFRSVETGACQYGVVPVENSSGGVIPDTLDSFLRSPLLIAGEVNLRIHHNLLGKGLELSQIREVYSHQQSLTQCRNWLIQHLPNIPCHAVNSNAEAARLAAERKGCAAIAGQIAAELYGLDLLAANIEDEPDNTTRFLVIGRAPVGPTGVDKTSLLLSTQHSPGALYKMLEPFARYGLNMTKIESRPSRRGAWSYVFFVDVEGHGDQPPLADALAELEQHVTLMKNLGSYPKALP